MEEVNIFIINGIKVNLKHVQNVIKYIIFLFYFLPEIIIVHYIRKVSSKIFIHKDYLFSILISI
jgi:hypothetical protein